MTCLACGTEIPPERVAAVRLLRGGHPVYCVGCQAKLDAQLRVRPEHVPEAMAVQTEVDVTDFGWGS